MSFHRKLLQTQPTGGAWTLTNAIEQYDSIIYQTSSALASAITGFFFKPDGTKLYTVSGATAYEYDLSTD